MTLEFEIPPQDQARMRIELQRTLAKAKMTRARFIYAAAIAICVGLLIMWEHTGDIKKPSTEICLFLSYMIFTSSVYGGIMMREAAKRKALKRMTTGNRQRVRVTPDRVDYFYETLNVSNTWASVRSLLQTRNYFFISFKYNACVPIPLTAFEDRYQIALFQRMVECFTSGKPLGSIQDGLLAKPVSWPPAPTTSTLSEYDNRDSEILPVLGDQIDQAVATKIPYSFNGDDLVRMNYQFSMSKSCKNIAFRILQPLAMCTFLIPIFAASSITDACVGIGASAVVLTVVTVVQVNKTLRSWADKRPTEVLTREIETDFEQFVVRTDSSCTNFSCSHFESVFAGALGICILLRSQSYIYIPRRCFSDLSAQTEFYAKLKSAIGP